MHEITVTTLAAPILETRAFQVSNQGAYLRGHPDAA